MRKSVLTLLFLFLALGVAWAQKKQITVTGTVFSAMDKEPLIGASVVCTDYPGTGAITDVNGHFTLKVPEGARTLTISCIGHVAQKVAITTTPLKVTLAMEDIVTDDVVIVAYGTQKRQSLVGAQASLGAKQLASRPVANVSSALAGAAPGVQVTTSSGQPGEGAAIRIRGFGSINASSSPLIVVDGAVFHGSLSEIPSEDIQNLAILKDAASTALYGSSAGNGVILVTTKRGAMGASQGIPTFTFSMHQGFSQRGLPSYDRVGVMDHYKLRWQQWYNHYNLNARKPNSMSEEDWQTYIKQQAALDVYESLKYNPYAGINTWYQLNNAGEYELSKTYDANKKPIPAIMMPNGQMNPEINGLLWGDDLDWEKALYKNGYRQEYTLSGGMNTERMKSFISLGYLDENGFLVKTNFKRYTGRANLSYDVRSYLTLGGSVSFAHTHAQSPGTLGSYTSNMPNFVQNIAPIYPMHLRNEKGQYVDEKNNVLQPKDRIYDHSKGRPYAPGFNAIETSFRDLKLSEKDAINTRAFVEIKPITGLKFQTTLSYDLTNAKSKHRRNNVMGDQPQGMLTYGTYRETSLTFNQLLSYQKTIDKHELEGLIGHENYDYVYAELEGQRDNLKLVETDELSAYNRIVGLTSNTATYRKEGYFGRINYSYDGRYNLSASYRRDGSSRFARNRRWGNFWSVGAGWNVSSEAFMKDVKWVNELKLRASIGATGNDGLSGYYPYQTLYSLSRSNYNEPGLGMSTFGNKDLVWESQMNSDIALDFALFKRVRGTVEFFNKESRDLLFGYNLPASSGVSSQTRNIGKVRNYGIEADLSVTVLSLKDFEWRVGANATFLKNKILRLPDANRDDGIETSYYKYMEGRSRYEYYLNEYLGVDPADGRAMYRLDKEKYPSEPGVNNKEWATYTKDGLKAKKHFAGTSIPDVYGGFSTSVSYKGITLSASFSYQLGGKTYDGTYQDLMARDLAGGRAMHKDLYRAWKKPGDITDVPALTAQSKEYSTLTSDRFLISSSALALKNVSLNYVVPEVFTKKLGLKGIALGAAAENIFLISARRGMNPMNGYTGVLGAAGYSIARTFTTSLKVTF